jgi:antibiotic biosynthesis monooxygenase (ABM) superfamily enzyme
MTTRLDIAQLNIGRAVAPLDDVVMADFMNWLDEINALAERSPGFVWRLQGDSGNNTDLKVSDDPRFIVNLSVWSSIEALYAFTYRSDHKTVFKRRHEWFERMGRPTTVLWWQPAGTVPSIEEALDRLDRLTNLGPTYNAFTFKQSYPPSDPADQGLPARRSA